MCGCGCLVKSDTMKLDSGKEAALRKGLVCKDREGLPETGCTRLARLL